MGENVSLIDGHIDNEPKQTNYDRIRNMSFEELAQFIGTVTEHCYYDECKGCPIYNVCGVRDCSDLHIRKYLESEVDSNDKKITEKTIVQKRRSKFVY